MPYLTKSDLEKRLYGIEQYRPGHPSTKDLHLAASSGTTTGLPSLHVVNAPVLERDQASQTWIAPLTSTVRLSRNNHMSLQNMHRTLIAEDSDRIIALDERDMRKENLSQIMEEYRPRCVNGAPSRILHFARLLDEAGKGSLCNEVGLVQAFGELFTPLHLALLTKTFPNAKIQNGYMFAGAHYPTAPCPASPGDRHHLLKGKFVTRLSVVDPDEDGVGEIVATTPELLDYRTGDLGTFDNEPCPCGQSPILTLHGRKNFDRISVLGTTFLKSEVERVLEPFADCIADYQLRVGERLLGKKLVGIAQFVFSPRDPALSARAIEEQLLRSLFVTKTRTLGDIIKEEIFMPLVTERVPEITHGKKRLTLRRMTAQELEALI